jgi:hypothetical protein
VHGWYLRSELSLRVRYWRVGKPSPTTVAVSTRLERIAKLAKDKPGVALTTLAHHIDLEWLREAYRRTRKDGATGVDGQSAEQYAERLDENLASLLDHAKSGTYRAPPVRRAYVPKGDGSQQRPIGITTFEDKVLQRAVAMVLEAVYEQEFHDSSYGFRPGRSALQACQAFGAEVTRRAGGWVLEVDIKKFFDTLDHRHLQRIIRQRVGDGEILCLIGKWLNAGLMVLDVTAKAIWQVRPDAASGQDAAGTVSSARPRRREHAGSRVLSPAGLYASLGLVSQGQVGGAQAHSQGPVPPHSTPHR